MAKILTDKEMAQIIHRAVHDKSTIDDAGTYSNFLADLAGLICMYFGGDPGNVGVPDFSSGRAADALPNELGWTCGFHVNDSVPDDGGIFADYDTDVKWIDGQEVSDEDQVETDYLEESRTQHDTYLSWDQGLCEARKLLGVSSTDGEAD